jgi:hypothetical protein
MSERATILRRVRLETIKEVKEMNPRRTTETRDDLMRMSVLMIELPF